MSTTSRSIKTNYDAIIIGGGHNGLITAAYLAQQKKSVLVVERRDLWGGCSVSEPLWPGYQVSTASYVVSLLLPEIIRDLQLKENGLEILRRDPSSFTPTRDGKYLLLGPRMRENQEQIAKFSQADAAAFPQYESLLEKIAEVIEPILNEPALDLLPLPASWRRQSWSKKMREWKQAYRMHGALSKLGNQLPEALEILTGAARPILERWFESDVLRATLATDAVIGAFASISSPGTAYVLLHHVMGTAGGARGVWGYIRGGMGGLAAALVKTCQQRGVDLLLDAPVQAILESSGRAQGIRLADGREFQAKVVASSIDAEWTFNRLLPPTSLPPELLSAVRRIDYSSASAKLNIALSEPPRFQVLPQAGVGPQHHGTMHICDSVEWIERAYADALLGLPSEKPILEMTLPTSVDPSVAPPGKHFLSVFVQYAPYRLKPGVTWDQIKDKFVQQCINTIAEYAPNVPGAIEHLQFLSPVDLEARFGLTGGNIFQGAMNLSQLFLMRPVVGWSDHRTPIQGLYMCGAASHPGGGVMGACGRNAAREILRDRLI